MVRCLHDAGEEPGQQQDANNGFPALWSLSAAGK